MPTMTTTHRLKALTMSFSRPSMAVVGCTRQSPKLSRKSSTSQGPYARFEDETTVSRGCSRICIVRQLGETSCDRTDVQPLLWRLAWQQA